MSSSNGDAAPWRPPRWCIVKPASQPPGSLRLVCRPTEETLLADRPFDFAAVAIGFGVVTVISACPQARVSELLK
jgi:hypothetical protein